MTDPKEMLVTLTAGQLAELIRAEIRAALNDRGPTVVSAPPVLTSDEAAAYLKIPVGVLRKKVRLGDVPSFKIGAVLRFRVAELDSWLDEHKTKKVG